jgi:hypothetical protein
MLATRVEKYFKTNEFLQRTAVPRAFDENPLQLEVNYFLASMQTLHGEDKRYQHIMKIIQNTKSEEPEPLAKMEKPMSNARVAGWFVKMFNWLRNRELRTLRTEYEQTLEMVPPPTLPFA